MSEVSKYCYTNTVKMAAKYKLKILYLFGHCVWYHALSFTSHSISELIDIAVSSTCKLALPFDSCKCMWDVIKFFVCCSHGYACLAHLSNPVELLFLGWNWRFFCNSMILFHSFIWGFVSCLWFNVKQLVYQNHIHYGLVVWESWDENLNCALYVLKV
jgi:hypothetical protein